MTHHQVVTALLAQSEWPIHYTTWISKALLLQVGSKWNSHLLLVQLKNKCWKISWTKRNIFFFWWNRTSLIAQAQVKCVKIGWNCMKMLENCQDPPSFTYKNGLCEWEFMWNRVKSGPKWVELDLKQTVLGWNPLIFGWIRLGLWIKYIYFSIFSLS